LFLTESWFLYDAILSLFPSVWPNKCGGYVLSCCLQSECNEEVDYIKNVEMVGKQPEYRKVGKKALVLAIVGDVDNIVLIYSFFFFFFTKLISVITNLGLINMEII
jgi:hypothetical protein